MGQALAEVGGAEHARVLDDLTPGRVKTKLVEYPDGKLYVRKLAPQEQDDGYQEALESYKRERNRCRDLDHDGIPRLGQENDRYFDREYVEGDSLRKLLNEGDIEGDELVDITLNVLDILDYAHREGVIHRDIKPDNIIYNRRDGHVALVDWGISKLKSIADMKTTFSYSGTPAYMAPEQWEDAHVYSSTDVYCLGATLLEILAGGVIDGYPGGETYLRTKRTLLDKVDNNYLAVLEGMLEFNHDERFQSAAKLKGVFEALKKGDSPEINLPVKRNIASADLIYDGGRDFSVSRAKFGFGEGVAVRYGRSSYEQVTMGGAVFRLFRGERHSWGYKGVLYVPNLGAHMEDYKIFNKLTERINNSRRMHVTDVTGWYSDAVRGGTNLKIRESKDDDSRELGDLVINKRNELSFDMKEYVRDSSTLIARIAQVGVCSTVGISSFVFPLVTTRMLDMAMLAAVFGCGLPGMCEVLVGEFVSMMSHRDHPSIGPIGAIPYLGARLHYKRKALNLNARLNSAIDNHGDYRVLESEFGDSRKMARAESRFAREMQFLDRIYDNTNNGKGLVLECERHDRQDVVEFFERLLDQRLVDRIKRR